MTQLTAKAPEERRRRILAAAIQVLVDKGFAGARIADVAAAAGTSPALVVYHFKTLDGALAAALASVEDEFYADLPDDASASPAARLHELGRLGTEQGPSIGDWTLWMEVWVRALRDPQAARLRRTLDVRWRAALRAIIDAGIADGTFRCTDPAASVLRLASLLDGLAVQVVLADPDLPAGRMTELWLDAAAAEVGLTPKALRRAGVPG